VTGRGAAAGGVQVAQEVQAVLLPEHRHALVVRRERAAQVHPEQALLDDDEGGGAQRGQHQGHGGQVPGEVRQQQRPFQEPAPSGTGPPGRVVGPAGPEDLPVPGLVPEEADLAEHRRQVHRHQQLPP
jgi:hypothetical protein